MKSMMTRAILSGLVLLALAGAAVAQAPPASAASPAGGAARFDAQAATEAYMATLSPEKRARSDASRR